MCNGEIVHCIIEVKARMTGTGVKRASEGDGQFADQPMVGNTKVAKLEGESDKMSDKVRGVNSSVDENSSVDVGVIRRRVDRGLHMLAG